MVKYYIAIKAEERRQIEAARIAEPETMEKNKWKGDDEFNEHQQKDIAAEIRKSLDDQRLAKLK